MNILYVNHGDLRSNSMGHIAPFANELTKQGHSCSVALDAEVSLSNPQSSSLLFTCTTHEHLKEGRLDAFPNARPADIVHAWTPRENVRKAVEAYRSHFPAAKLIIHLEDNEDAILASAYQRPIERLRHPNPHDPEPDWIQRLAHPVEYKRLLASADAVTLIAAPLEKLLPTAKPACLITPIIDTARYADAPDAATVRAKHKLPPQEKLFVFPGGITSSNREDLRSLYLAVKLLQEKGIPCRVVKTGPSCSEFEASFAFPLESICTNLGYVDETALVELLAVADILVQPGKDNPFNRDRFPCKIPEFFASGRPCIVPAWNDPQPNEPESCCLTLTESSPREIANQAKRILEDPTLAKKLGEGARAHAQRCFSAEANTAVLLQFYELVSNETIPSSDKGFQYKNLSIENEALRAENEALEKTIDELHSQVAQRNHTIGELRVERARLHNETLRLADKIQRASNSASWKLTAPLRFLRRALIDPFKEKPVPAPVVESTEERQAIKQAYPAVAPTPSNLPPEGHPSYHKNYYQFVQRHEERIANYCQAYIHSRPKSERVRISILLPVYNVDTKWLRRCIDSVRDQVYQNWELCIADDKSTRPDIKPLLEEYAQQDDRIKLLFRETNGHISLATNSAYTLSTGDYLALLDHDDELTPDALAKVAETIENNPQAKLIYSDEDKIDENGLRHGPHFKSDWNYDLFLGCNMICHLAVYRRDAFAQANGFRTGVEGAQDWDLALRVTESISPREIVHIPEILYHWRSIEGSTAFNIDQKNYAYDAQKRAIEEHFERLGVKASLHSIKGIHWRVSYQLPTPRPLVSIVIPTRDRVDLLKPCIESIQRKTDYANYEIVIVDNESRDPAAIEFLDQISQASKVRIVKRGGGFNYSELSNFGVDRAKGEIVVLLNNDTEIISEEWLSEIASHALRPEIGVIGAKLLFPHDHVQHCGVIMGIGGVAGHAFRYLHRDDDGHIHRAQLTSCYSAVTGACMAFRKSLWKELGGLDSENLAVSYNDVDFCLKALDAGYRNIVTPFALLYHKESGTRGYERTAEQQQQFDEEYEYMLTKWSGYIKNDPFYNINLTRDIEDFSYSPS